MDEPFQPPPLRRRIWFYLTISRLVAWGLLWAGITVFMFMVTMWEYTARRYESACGAAVVAALLVLIGFMRAVILRRNIHQGARRELKRRNCCPHCEYDLRASSLRCPECGRALPAANIEI